MIGVAAAVIAAGVIAVVLTTDDDAGKGTPNASPTLVTGRGLDTGGEQLATLLAGAHNHTFHAHYAVRGSSKLLGGTLELEWWNTEGHSRIDTTRTTGGSVTRTTTIVNGAEGVGCQQLGAKDWTCHSIDVPAPGDPNGMVSTLTMQLSGRPVTERAGKIDGRSARCFHVGGADEPIDVCTNSDGVLLRNATPHVAYVITALDDNVPASVFNPPARVSH
jgi:hypothetical protein